MINQKNCFLYFPKNKKYFDFSSNFSSEVFQYHNGFIKKKFKNLLSQKNALFEPDKIKNLNFKKLIRQFPFLEKYFFFLITEKDLLYFFLKNSINLYLDPLEERLGDDFALIQKEKYVNSQSNFNLISDLLLEFNQISSINLEEKRSNILYLNSTFPNFSLLPSENYFPIIIVGGNHPWGFNQYKLVLVKKDFPYSAFFTPRNSVHYYYFYKAGIEYYQKIIKSNNFKKTQKILLKRITSLENHKSVLKIEFPKDENLFLYKIHLKPNNQLSASRSHGQSTLRLQQNGISFYFLKNIIYINLPVNISLSHLTNKIKKLAEII